MTNYLLIDNLHIYCYIDGKVVSVNAAKYLHVLTTCGLSLMEVAIKLIVNLSRSSHLVYHCCDGLLFSIVVMGYCLSLL